MNEQCLCLLDSKKDDEVAVPVCAQEHERYFPAPPHPTGNWSWKSSACVCWTARKIMTWRSPTPFPEGSVCTTETLLCAQVSQNPVCAAESILCAQVSRCPFWGLQPFKRMCFRLQLCFCKKKKKGYILHPGATQIWLDRWDPKDQTIRFPRQDSNVNLPVWPENYKLESPTNRWAVFKSPTGWRLQEINTKYFGDDHGPWAASSNQPDQTGLEWPGFWTLRCGCKVVPPVINGL